MKRRRPELPANFPTAAEATRPARASLEARGQLMGRGLSSKATVVALSQRPARPKLSPLALTIQTKSAKS